MHKKFYEKIVMQRDNTIAATRIIAINPAKYFFPFEFLKLIISFTSYLFLYYYTFERSKLCFLSYSYALSFLLFFPLYLQSIPNKQALTNIFIIFLSSTVLIQIHSSFSRIRNVHKIRELVLLAVQSLK